jgi:hypothetical protein
MIPHTPRPAPRAITTVCNVPTAELKNAIISKESQTLKTPYFVGFLHYRVNPRIVLSLFCRLHKCLFKVGFASFLIKKN